MRLNLTNILRFVLCQYTSKHSRVLNFDSQTKVLMHVRMLCAISFSNDHFGCRINASHLIALGMVTTSLLFVVTLILLTCSQEPASLLAEKSNGAFLNISKCYKTKGLGLVEHVRRCCGQLGKENNFCRSTPGVRLLRFLCK